MFPNSKYDRFWPWVGPGVLVFLLVLAALSGVIATLGTLIFVTVVDVIVAIVVGILDFEPGYKSGFPWMFAIVAFISIAIMWIVHYGMTGELHHFLYLPHTFQILH